MVANWATIYRNGYALISLGRIYVFSCRVYYLQGSTCWFRYLCSVL